MLPFLLTVLLAVVLGTLTLWLWLPNLVDLTALGALLTRGRAHRKPDESTPLPRLVFLVPAHNEELLITQCVRSLVSQDYPAELRRVIVIADNSTDGTARLARAAGGECFERFDTEQKGKPRALAWAIRQLDLSEIDACVIVDADTMVAPDFANGLAALRPLDRIAAQAYVGTMNEWDNWLTRLAGVLARCRYDVTYALRDRAGLNCPLTGNGMCIGSRLLEPHGWQAFSLTENWELYAQYGTQGVSIRFATGSRLYTQQVRSMEQGRTQRSRWLAGKNSVLREWGPKMIRSTVTPTLEKFATLVELAELTPVMHLVMAVTVALAALLLPSPARFWIMGAAGTSLLTHVVATLVVLIRHPHPAATLAAFLRLPAYAAWRVSVAASTHLIPDTGEWRKTERHAP